MLTEAKGTIENLLEIIKSALVYGEDIIVSGFGKFQENEKPPKRKSNFMEQIDPKHFGLPSRTVLIKRGPNEFSLIMNRKSRIVMKDVLVILEKVKKIKQKVPNALIILETNAPVCSKSNNFLKENDVRVKKNDR